MHTKFSQDSLNALTEGEDISSDFLFASMEDKKTLPKMSTLKEQKSAPRGANLTGTAQLLPLIKVGPQCSSVPDQLG